MTGKVRIGCLAMTQGGIFVLPLLLRLLLRRLLQQSASSMRTDATTTRVNSAHKKFMLYKVWIYRYSLAACVTRLYVGCSDLFSVVCYLYKVVSAVFQCQPQPDLMTFLPISSSLCLFKAYYKIWDHFKLVCVSKIPYFFYFCNCFIFCY